MRGGSSYEAKDGKGMTCALFLVCISKLLQLLPSEFLEPKNPQYMCLKVFEFKNNVRDNITEEKVKKSCLSNSFFFTALAVVCVCVYLGLRCNGSGYHCLLSKFNLKMFPSPTSHLPS